MMMRSIAALLCMLYLSVGTVFAAAHHHEDASAVVDDSQCAACIWHHNGQVDSPPVAPSVVRTESFVFVLEPPDFFVRELSLVSHPSRAPPLTLL